MAPMPKQHEKPARPKVTIIPGRGVSQTINYLLEDRDDLEWLVAVGRNKSGEIFFYDTGGDIVEDLGTLEYLKERITRAHLGFRFVRGQLGQPIAERMALTARARLTKSDKDYACNDEKYDRKSHGSNCPFHWRTAYLGSSL